MWNRKVFIRVIEVLLCIACVITLRVTDDESRRVFHYLRSRSREWSILNNVTWGAIGAALATATCGGYVIITLGLLVAAATGELRGRKTELLFLGAGVILFSIVAALSLASIEDVPSDLVDNAAVLGALCLVTALVFIADLLMGTPKTKDKQGTPLDDKKIAKHVTTTMTVEKELKSTSPADTSTVSKTKDDNGNVNNGFERMDDLRRKNNQEESNGPRSTEHDRSPGSSNRRAKDALHEGRHDDIEYIDREPREYTQNYENGRTLRDSQRFREAETQKSARRDAYEVDRRMEMPRVVYKSHDIYRRPVDEVDTPRFPVETDRRTETVFAKIINPGVKIMRVEHDVDEAFDNYRFSDSSQYDNVPIKMRGSSSGILKKNRDVSFTVPPPPHGYGKGHDKSRDEIEVLEECFGVLRTTSTGTQTPGLRTPSSPTDPGYVRHTASNWPHESKTKTPGSSPTGN